MKLIIKSLKEPKVGDLKIIKKFAWLPTKLRSTEYIWLIWLEFYYEKYEYQLTPYLKPGNFRYCAGKAMKTPEHNEDDYIKKWVIINKS